MFQIHKIPEGYQPSEHLLEGRIILITGAGAGIGRCLAIETAKRGAKVILCGRTIPRLESVYDEICQLGRYHTPALLPLDLTTATAELYDEVAAGIASDYGRLDGLVHNAGILGQRTPIEGYRTDVWKQVIDVNVTAPFELTKACLPLLHTSDDARILFTSSGVGRTGRAFWGAYSVSKFATEGLMQVLADELDGVGNIGVNAINPGATRTAMRASAFPAEHPQQVTPPQALMPTYLYLLSSDSKAITGKTFDAQ